MQDVVTRALDDPNVSFDLILTHTGQNDLSDPARQIFDDLLGEMNDTTEVVSYRFLNQAAIHKLVTGRLRGEAINLEVALLDYGLIEEPFTAYYGKVEAVDVAGWWEEHGTKLLAQNLRELIPDSEVNESITQTLLTEPEKFWYFNNGITALAEKVARKPIGAGDRRSGSFVCEGVSIVNGAQTVGSIGQAHARDPAAVARARVVVRFISLEDAPEGLASEITRATNTQNRIERRDFVSLDPEQHRLRTELKFEGIDYSIKTGEPDPSPESGCSVTEATIALACALADPTHAVQAKREIGRLWEDIDKAPYKAIFNGSVSGMKLWRCVEVMRAVEAGLKAEQGSREGRTRGVSVHGNRLILHLVFRSLPVDQLGDPSYEFPPVLAQIPHLTTRILDEMTEIIEREFPSNYLASLFKNAARCRKICDLMPPIILEPAT